MFFDLGSSKKHDLKEYYDMVIIGGGPAGVAAGIYAVQGGIQPLIIEKDLEGGQINLTEYVENYPGFKSITGEELATKLGEHAREFGVEFYDGEVINVDFSKDEKIISLDNGSIVKAKTVVIATGATPRKLGVPGEMEFAGRGVSYCATCDGHFFKNQKVAVIGGGNTAVEEALYLSKIAKEVYIIHRRDKLRADKRYQDKAFNTENIKFIWNSVVKEIKGDKKVTQLVLENRETGEITNFDVDGVFVFVGLTPVTELFKGKIELDDYGYIPVDEHRETNVKGVFAAGDVIQKELRQIITAAADGAIAASFAVREYFN
ncbi:thioredoxin reductase [Marinitoga sp. 1135]|uniref:Thioredoxin reductase n=1 Tax=Marinitoga piezophila (strain DSM 14283 / JCM 11233 / KA3) TaxID=443254 RepID=H2J558_MARPK|nr:MULTISPECIES: thioredoxin-disulfide reductase [Marinitoga]AEX86075.1 thioredoxin-disulfide reductase [Marinitoga piezophila KA3]APT76493.1 thioredoxin reductase [Marinitoga sp. 1137]NUU96262.1 thioredoxin reductase [Marinitoga sp. 1135]NUU98181.1 thioredoxin reductase [Marinitoga sp. 1138]